LGEINRNELVYQEKMWPCGHGMIFLGWDQRLSSLQDSNTDSFVTGRAFGL